jgi:hypothetical protein
MGGSHFAGPMGGSHFAGPMGGRHFAEGGWNGGHALRSGEWRGHEHFADEHFHDHFHHFHDHNRFVAVGVGGWWPGYYDYGYGYGGCGWLYNRAAITGSPYWWDRYYACTSYYY